MTKALTIQELLARKEALKQRKKRTQTLHIDSLEAAIVIQEPSQAVAAEGLEMAKDDTKSELADAYIVYHCTIQPNLRDTELQKAYGCAEPTDIVGMLFLPGEISAISGHALQLAGYGNGVKKIDDQLKN